LVRGAACAVGGVRHGTLRFSSDRIRNTCAMLALATAALVLPSIATYTHAPASDHSGALSVSVAVILLVGFALSLPSAIRRGRAESSADPAGGEAEVRWPLWLAVGLLTA